MPYIKKIYRPNLFKRIQEINCYQDRVLAILDLAHILDDLPTYRNGEPNQFHGALNYTCTQLIRHKPQYAEQIINGLLSIYFTNNKNVNYISLKDCGGLLHRMKCEFDRRNWKNVEIIEKLQRWVDVMVANPYEDKKEQENGDLE
jgi:hypothetical protein